VCVCVCVCVSVCECINECLPTWWAWTRAGPVEVFKFWCWPDSRCGFGIIFPLSLTLHAGAFCDNLQHFSWNDQPVVSKLGEVMYTSRSTHPIHFGIARDSNIHFQIQIRIRDFFGCVLRLDVWIDGDMQACAPCRHSLIYILLLYFAHY